MTDGLTRAGFDTDLRVYAPRADVLAGVLCSRGCYLYEHKCDCGCVRTGNLFVEYRYKGRPSGIATTSSHHWAFEYDADRWLLVPTRILTGLTRIAYTQGRAVRGGDHNASEGVLLPIRWLVPPYSQDWTKEDRPGG